MPDWRSYVREHLHLPDARPEREADIVEEIARQLEDAYEEARRQGLSEAEAEVSAVTHVADWQKLSDELRLSRTSKPLALDRLIEQSRDRSNLPGRMGQFFYGVWFDVLFAWRLLAKNRGFAIAAILTMAIGIGANTAVFSIIDSALFFPLPYPQASRIIFATTVRGDGHPFVSKSVFASWKNRNRSLASIAAYSDIFKTTLTGAGVPDRLPLASVSSGFFSVLGVGPMLGRAFLPSELQPGGPAAVILSYPLWRSRFDASPKAVGKTIYLNDKPFTVVGVMAPGFEFPGTVNPAVLVPLQPSDGPLFAQRFGVVDVLGRLKPGVGVASVQADLETILQQDAERAPALLQRLPKTSRTIVMPLRERLVGKTRSALLVLWGAVGFLLLIACVNVANLALARALAREKEIAVRVALGAERRRVMRQLLTESVLVATLGGMAGIAIACAVVWVVRHFGPAELPRLHNATIDFPVLLFTLGVSVLAGILAGLAPARAAWRLPAAEGLKEGARSSTGRGHRRLRSALMVAEIAMALMLAIGAGLLVGSFLKITGLDLGLDPHNVLTAELALPLARYATPAEQLAFAQSLLKRIRSLPGVVATAGANDVPMAHFNEAMSVKIQGMPTPSGPRGNGVGLEAVTPGFFRTMRIPFLAGRDFNVGDSASTAPVAIVNQAFVRHFLPNRDPIGERIGRGSRPMRIVGVVANVRQQGLLNAPFPTLYNPYAQQPTAFVSLLIRASGNPEGIAPALRAQVEQLDDELPVFGVATMDQRLAKMEAERRFEMIVLTAFAIVALLLAALGVYGVISYSVSERTHEIGIRMALGAKKGTVMRIVMGKTLVLAFLGVATGVGGALALTRYLQSLLFQIRPDDPLTFALAAALLLATALLAGFLPARRATAIAPITALRYE
jgi:putative ABC transport system permease protein